jgi:hypothetical protein
MQHMTMLYSSNDDTLNIKKFILTIDNATVSNKINPQIWLGSIQNTDLKSMYCRRQNNETLIFTALQLIPLLYKSAKLYIFRKLILLTIILVTKIHFQKKKNFLQI